MVECIMICLMRTCNQTTQRSIWKSEVELVSSSAQNINGDQNMWFLWFEDLMFTNTRGRLLEVTRKAARHICR